MGDLIGEAEERACRGEDDYTQEMCHGRQQRVLSVERGEQDTYEIRCGDVDRADRKLERNKNITVIEGKCIETVCNYLFVKHSCTAVLHSTTGMLYTSQREQSMDTAQAAHRLSTSFLGGEQVQPLPESSSDPLY